VNCDQVETRLSDYLDRNLDSATLKDVEEHLLSCSRCSVEAWQLTDFQRRVANLDTIDPPLGFTERVMARVREIETKPSLWERLLFPLSFKLPIHAAAVVLIGIMALYLLRRVPSGEEADLTAAPSMSASEGQKTAGLQRELQGITGPAQRNEKDSETASVNPQAESRQEPKAATERVERGGSGEGLTALADRQSGEKELKRVLPSRPPPGKSNFATDETSRAGSKSLTENAPSKTVPGTAELRERVTGAEPSAALPSSPDTKGGGSTSAPAESAVRQFRANPDVELVARRARPVNAQRRDSLSAFNKSAESESIPREEASKLSAPLLPEIPLSDKPQEVWLTITRAQYDQLKRELLAVGSIEAESWLSSREQAGAFGAGDQLRIKVTVLPPEP